MNEDTFDVFYENSFDRVVGQVYVMCGSLTEAQDCVQEAFIRAWDKRRSLDQSESPEAWVRTVAYRLAVSRWRRTRLNAKLKDRSLPHKLPMEPGVERVALSRALQELPAEQRRAIVLFHLCDLTLAEVADEVGAPLGTVKARLSRGRKALSVLLAEHHPELADRSDQTTTEPALTRKGPHHVE